jgi:hypothetical protein
MVVLNHVGRLQILVIDSVVGLDQSERNFMVEVLALAFHLHVRLGEQLHGFATAVASLLAS